MEKECKEMADTPPVLDERKDNWFVRRDDTITTMMEIQEWIQNTANYKYYVKHEMSIIYLFESKRDAMCFKLKYGSNK